MTKLALFAAAVATLGMTIATAQQGETPETPAQVYWAIIAALSSAVAVLFWQLQKTNDRYVELVHKSIESANGITMALVALREALETMDELTEIKELLREYSEHRKPR